MIFGAVRLTSEVDHERSDSGQKLAGSRPSFLRLVFKDAVRIVRFFGCHQHRSVRKRPSLTISVKLPLLWFSKDCPSADFSFVRPVQVRHSRMAHLRSRIAKCRTPSARVVPPNSDGLLRTLPCRFIAPYCQPWGSSRFQPSLPSAASLRPLVPCAFPALAPHTLRSLPPHNSRHASPHTLPSRRSIGLPFPALQRATSRLFSVAKSVAISGISTAERPDAPLGFVPLQGSPLIAECSHEGLRSPSAEADVLWSQPLTRLRPGFASIGMEAEYERSHSSQRLCSGCCLPRHPAVSKHCRCRPADDMPACH